MSYCDFRISMRIPSDNSYPIDKIAFFIGRKSALEQNGFSVLSEDDHESCSSKRVCMTVSVVWEMVNTSYQPLLHRKPDLVWLLLQGDKTSSLIPVIYI